MIRFQLPFVFLLMPNSFAVNNALEMEEIVGGHPALQSEFKYQAAIMGKYNFNYATHLLCSAGIISRNLLLSSARCFLSSNYELKKMSFFGIVGTDILIGGELVLREIEAIYTYEHNDFRVEHNLAAAKLKINLNMQFRRDLFALEIPSEDETFYDEIGIVAGFGLDSINILQKHRQREQIRVSGKSAILLKYSSVKIINPQNFTGLFELLCDEIARYFTELCGIMLPDESYDYRGICKGDIGAPLVIGTKVVGIVSRHNDDCNDIKEGTVYTKISKFKSYLDGLILETPINGTRRFDNPTHNPNIRTRNLV